jgi:hypothetical protein
LTIYLELTREFNAGRLRAILSSGQAVVLHRLAVASKDGDWILREDAEALDHVLSVLDRRGARYRFGAPLDRRWMAGGWSAHLEFRHDSLRIRTDFVTRPPRISAPDLEGLWREMEGRDPPFVGARLLADLKRTNREKDYAVIGELARIMTDPRDRLLYSRSAQELIGMAGEHPALVRDLAPRRPVLALLGRGRDKIEEALDAERRVAMRQNERRLEAYLAAASAWSSGWPDLARRLEGKPLREAHPILVEEALAKLPARVEVET